MNIGLFDFYKACADHIKKTMMAGDLTGQQTVNRSDLSAAPLKEEKTNKNTKNVAVPTLDQYPARIRKCFVEYDMQKSGVEQTMKEFARGTLKDSHGKKVTDKKQALAIGYNS
jgi:hypothetical protein